MPAARRRRELLRKRLSLFTRMLHGVDDGDVRALHRTRVASRRLRELLPILQLDNELARKLARRLRAVTRRLGPVRELDVLLLVLNELGESGRDQERALGPVIRAVTTDRLEAQKRLRTKLPSAELRRLARKLEGISDWPDTSRVGRGQPRDTAWRWAVDARIASRAERLVMAMREAGAVYLPDRLHQVRITLKKLRYAVELRTDIAGMKGSAELRTLKHAQDLLGRMHDLQMLIDRVRQVQAALEPPDVARWDDLDALVDRLEDDCRRLHARYMRARPALAAVCAQSVARPRVNAPRGVAVRRAIAS